MNDFVMARADVRVLLWHLALYGLGAILHDAGQPDVRLSWTPGMQPRGRVTADGLTSAVVDDVVREHARVHATESSWVSKDVELVDAKGKSSRRGLMSPRLAAFTGPQVWQHIQATRHQELDRLTASQAWLDLRQLAALGEPCYWSHNRQGAPLQDDGASRLEMQPRNRGSEFVGSRLRKLAQTVGTRTQGQVAAGLDGSLVLDEAGSAKVDSRTATGLAALGPTDNAVAWCALWGISHLPITPRINATGITSGHIGRIRSEWFYTPVWERPWRPARLRTILAAQALRDVAAIDLPARWATDPAAAVAARDWLTARGVIGVVRFPIERFGSDNAPERRAMNGSPLPTKVR